MQPTGRRRWWAIVAAASLVTSGLAMAPATASPEPEGEGPSGSIDADVSAELEAEGRADVWVRFADRPDMSQFAQIPDWNERGQAVVDALKASAEASQGTLRDSLDDQGMDYEAFWATNSLRVSGADPELVTSMSHAAGVEGIYPTMQIEVPEPEPATPQMAPNAVEWGVNDINAPEVWDEGIDGQDIVVASIDTGAQWDHPALINQYRGYNGPGDVDHNYSWFDAAGTSPSFPADTNGHGTHVTGTMVGDDGGDNQIGVAPGARWIAANGCCPNDAALINSGQWMLEPTDLDGENPDVSMRPHVINNSWGTTVPSNDPFMSDIIEAWAASGQFGVFANGNNGPGCATSGAPGSLIVSYSVGNYNSSHNISATSSRGPGQDGEIKPDIAAPGSAIRSAWPGSGYNTISGTSMASPHVAGAVALAWSASPTLSGDIEETRDLLDGTAIDTEDLQCGGTAENNNVFGEGRLDAHALVDEAPRGDAGTLTGVVIDAEDETPIAGAQVHVVGPLERTLVTNSEGAYNALLTAGTYEMTVTAFGYQTHTDTVTVEVDETTTVNVALEAAPSATVSGVVTDGSGYGFPLYARIAAEGTPEATFTDPETGEYSFDIPAGATYTLTVQVQYDGYTTPSREVTVDDDTAEDFAVPVNAETCTAPGYHIVTDGLWETFDEQELPEGWEIVDHQGNGQVWRFDDPGNRGNMTGGEGGFAVVNSDFYGSGNTQNTTLVTPSIDMSGDETPAVGFNTDYYRFTNDVATVRVSLDGGDTWEDVEQWTASRRGPREELIPLPMAAGESDVRIGFNYQGTWGWWWQLDNVFVGERSCVPAGEGGYVVGNVYDNYDEGIVGATVTNLDAPEESAVTTATPADENLDDGFYWIFSANPGENLFEASARNYESQTQDVTVVHADAVRADFTLGSGLLVVEPTEIESTQVQDEVEEHTLSVTNTGTGAAEVELLEGGGDFTPQAGHGVDSEPVTLDVPTSFAAFADDEAAVGTFDEGFAPNDTWEPMPNYPRVVMDNRVVNVDGNYYSLGGTTGTAAFADVNRFNSATETWEAVAPMPQAASAVNAAAVGDQIVVSGGWVASATSTNTYVYDVAGDSWTQVASAPTGVSASGTAVIDGTMYVVGGCSTADCTPMSNVAMAYDVANDSWEQLANYPTPAAFNVCGAVDGELVCSGGNPGSGGIASTYAYDPGADTWQELESAPTPHWAAGGATANGMLVVQGGVQGPGAGAVSSATYAFDGGEWTTLDAASTPVYRGDIACGIAKVGGSTGGFSPTAAAERLPGWDDCETFTDVEWLDLEPDTFTVGAGETVEVTVTTDSTGLDLGTYTASIHVRSNTPQSIDPIPVTMNVVELPIEVERWAGEDRYETAVLVSQGYEPGVDTVIVATGRNYPDALTGSALAGSVDAPVLLTRPDTLNMVTAEELERLQPGRVLVVGGVNAVQDRVVDMIRNVVDAPVERVSGTDRYGTAVAVSGEFDSAEYVYVATGRDYPDALAAAPRAGAEDSPVLLVPHDRIPAAVKAELDRLAPSQIRVLGGDGAVDDAVVLELRREHGPTVRLAGEDRYETNVRVTATYEDVDRVYVASGQNWPDALTGGARAASDEAPLLLTRAHALPGVIATEVERLHPDDAVVLGGPRVVSENVITQLRELR